MNNLDSVRKPIDYTDRFIIIEMICAYGKGETFRFFYHSNGHLCTALTFGDGRAKVPGDKVYFRDIKENGLATPTQTERYNRMTRRTRKTRPDNRPLGSIDYSLLGLSVD